VRRVSGGSFYGTSLKPVTSKVLYGVAWWRLTGLTAVVVALLFLLKSSSLPTSRLYWPLRPFAHHMQRWLPLMYVALYWWQAALLCRLGWLFQKRSTRSNCRCLPMPLTLLYLPMCIWTTVSDINQRLGWKWKATQWSNCCLVGFRRNIVRSRPRCATFISGPNVIAKILYYFRY